MIANTACDDTVPLDRPPPYPVDDAIDTPAGEHPAPAVPRHRQVPVPCPAGRTIDVDAEIAPLMAGLWELGIPTRMSCQAVIVPACPGVRVWIDFSDAEAMKQFVGIVMGFNRREIVHHDQYDPHRLSERVRGPYYPGDDLVDPVDRWHYEVGVFETRVDVTDVPRPHLYVAVRFPVADYPDVLAAVRNAVEDKKEAT